MKNKNKNKIRTSVLVYYIFLIFLEDFNVNRESNYEKYKESKNLLGLEKNKVKI